MHAQNTTGLTQKMSTIIMINSVRHVSVTSQTQTPLVVTLAVTCDFETDLCGWQPVPDTGYAFRRHQGPTDDRTSGPDTDHTYQGQNSMLSTLVYHS
jgi:hypothetical protein